MIRAKNLVKKFGDFTAVDNVSLNIKPGEIYGFLGPNGAGKTTTIRMLTGTLRPTSGEVEILNMNMKEKEIEIKANIGVVPDEPRMYENLRGTEFIEFIMNIYEVDKTEAKKRFDEICEIFEINYLDSFIGDYSHGMKQKLMVASVLMRKPKVIFLDEPTVGLDAKSAKLLKMLIEKYAKEGATIFMTTHILEIAEKMCDRIGIISKGKLIAEGTLEELKHLSETDEKQSLEDLFLELTGAGELDDIIKEL
ncbi:ABC transporter [Marinitoga sp. 1135]|uniref:ABC-type multidrug transport system, ATPase component n=1 Tax=Marinitoga piezophila (strain DSM 14283 / JCM 11233 / KA3) TaxID=443254 RepID=H2J527_MARPK|nr:MULTISPECIES: ABC transporter ATP-binding protein [Marinitoga]AEX86044.1 ABC-type multidrug transport system, ATPase component [Marinitoga piezophila KA3]APT76466.1 ABC transporter [Marinitoga sp. 1137]NUU96227.1 ABC transporter [Marinitoga sp. 1135]NUU98150.1 ABC transporter [Marinitoga sp. 1138]